MPKRKVVKHPNYELAVANLAEEFDRAREIIAGAEWSIQRSPESDGIRIKDIDVWQAKLLAPSFPSQLIFYVFDDEKVTFLTIKNDD